MLPFSLVFVLYNYNQTEEDRELEEGINQIQTIAATINELYSNSVTPPASGNANMPLLAPLRLLTALGLFRRTAIKKYLLVLQVSIRN